jgi:hypothetical protein
MTLREFFEKEIIPLHKETDWKEKAREVRERILRGEFVIAGLVWRILSATYTLICFTKIFQHCLKNSS